MPDTNVVAARRDGERRALEPAETVRLVRPLAPIMGITRLADVTGLDCIGIPVVMACRPNARSLSVSQGKGTTLDAARASALMEAVELFHAENVVLPLKLGSYEELRYGHALIDVTRLPRQSTTALDLHRPILWVEGQALGGERMWVPFETVHTIYATNVVLPTTGCLAMSSNGLASGNLLVEAVAHGLYELIERDATALALLAPEAERAARRLDLDSVDDPTCRALLARFADADVLVGAWDVTADVGLPVFNATICDRDPSSPRGLFGSSGSGCHPSRSVALARALTEAAQSRLTYVSGARDDMARSLYRSARDRDLRDRLRSSIATPGTRAFGETASFDGDTIEEELAHAREALSRAGFDEIIVVELTRPELRVPVARVLVPGLEGNVEDGIACLSAAAPERSARGRASGGAS